MIQLTNAESKAIKLIKGHYQGVYPYRGSWHVTFKPLFYELYGWSPNQFKGDYIYCLFNLLFDTYMKIADDRSGTNNEIRRILQASFHKSISRPQRRPIERALSQLCGLIQNNAVLDDNKNKRYEI
jgi:hypothetical protein